MSGAAKKSALQNAAQRVADADWRSIGQALSEHGYAVVPRALDDAECAAARDLYARTDLFRSRIVMARRGFGQGEYQYFAYPLPALVQALRETLYPRLAPIANAWASVLGGDKRNPSSLPSFLKQCHAAGQTRPTPLMLKYGAGDYNRLHQDLYGGIQFPLQATVLLSTPGKDFDGGAFVLTETAPRRQTRVEVVPLRLGDMGIFAVNQRPARSAKGYYRVAMRHGVSTVRNGSRLTLGVIFHDAE